MTFANKLFMEIEANISGSAQCFFVAGKAFEKSVHLRSLYFKHFVFRTLTKQ